MKPKIGAVADKELPMDPAPFDFGLLPTTRSSTSSPAALV